MVGRWVALAGILAAAPALAEPGTVHLVVVDPSEIPIPGVQVELAGPTGGRTLRTGDLGDARIALEAGEWTVSVRKPGFLRERLAGTVVPGRDVHLTVLLRYDASGGHTSDRPSLPLRYVGASTLLVDEEGAGGVAVRCAGFPGAVHAPVVDGVARIEGVPIWEECRVRLSGGARSLVARGPWASELRIVDGALTAAGAP